jgi:outer membrane protein assembly factor BamB
VPAIADLDLDGVEEVIVGNAWYNADGVAVWYDPSADDGMIGIANLDDDPEGEIVASSFNTVRVIDTNGRVLWGPLTIPSANIVSPSAIEDIDLDGYPEIVVAGGNNVYALNHDGTTLWTARATDMSGASGASVFDFEGDGQPEVVYIDEVQMIAFDGLTGAVKFYSSEHASDTMMDYPVIADVDNDNNAEIVVCHANYGEALSVYGDRDASWAPGRKVWNQHAYSISNVNDDLTVPQTAVQNFTTFNSWHSTLDRVDGSPLIDLAADVVDVCLDDCDEGTVLVSFRLLNRSESAIDVGTPMAVYARRGSVDTLLGAVVVPDLVAGGWSSPSYTLEIMAADLAGADALVVVADDNGTTTFLTECTETNNAFVVDGPFCD